MKKQDEYIAILKEERDLAAKVQKQKRKAGDINGSLYTYYK